VALNVVREYTSCFTDTYPRYHA